MSTNERSPESAKNSNDNTLDDLAWMERNGALRPVSGDQEPEEDDLDHEPMTDAEIDANWNFGTRAEHEKNGKK